MPTVVEELTQEFLDHNLSFDDWLYRMQAQVMDVVLDAQQSRIVPYGRRTMVPQAVTNAAMVATRRSTARLNKQTQDYYKTQFDKIYLAGAHKIDPAFTIGPNERRILAKENLTEYLKLRDAQNSVVSDTSRFIDFVRTDVSGERTALGWRTQKISRVGRWDNYDMQIQHRGVKAVSYRDGKKYKYGDYSKMQIKSNAQRMYNMGTIHAAEAKGITHLVIEDGPECGLTSHHDPQTANGMVVTIEEAASYPIAHPNCVRTFRPATDKEIKDDERKHKSKADLARQVATVAAKGAVAVLLASEATNLAVRGLERFTASNFYEAMIEDIALRSFQGDVYANAMVHRMEQFKFWFNEESTETAQVLRGQGHLEFPGMTREKFFGTTVLPGGPQHTDIPIIQQIRIYADGFFEGGIKYEDIPNRVKSALGHLEEQGEEMLGDRFQLFYRFLKKQALAEENAQQILSIAEYELRQRGIFERTLGFLPGSPDFRATFTKWGPRIRVNVSDYIRGVQTMTQAGPVRALLLNPAGAFRGTVRQYADGLLGGHISLIPKGWLRAIIEIDQRGQIVGNIRLVPGGPVRINLNFEAVERADDISRFRRGKLLNPLDLRDLYRDPSGLLDNAATKLRYMRFTGLEVNYNIFNESVFNISTNMRIPFSEVKTTIERLLREGYIRKGSVGDTYTGLFKYLITNPERIQEVFKPVKATIFGNIRFSGLSEDALQRSNMANLLKRGHVRILNSAHISSNKLQDVVTNMRIRGYNAYDISNVLGIRWTETKQLLNNGLWRMRSFLEDNNILALEDITPMWDRRVQQAMRVVELHVPNANKAETLNQALEPLYFDLDTPEPWQTRALMRLAGVDYGEPYERVRNKLSNLVNFIATMENDSPAVLKKASNIHDPAISALARTISDKTNLRVVTGGSDEGRFISSAVKSMAEDSARMSIDEFQGKWGETDEFLQAREILRRAYFNNNRALARQLGDPEFPGPFTSDEVSFLKDVFDSLPENRTTLYKGAVYDSNYKFRIGEALPKDLFSSFSSSEDVAVPYGSGKAGNLQGVLVQLEGPHRTLDLNKFIPDDTWQSLEEHIVHNELKIVRVEEYTTNYPDGPRLRIVVREVLPPRKVEPIGTALRGADEYTSIRGSWLEAAEDEIRKLNERYTLGYTEQQFVFNSQEQLAWKEAWVRDEAGRIVPMHPEYDPFNHQVPWEDRMVRLPTRDGPGAPYGFKVGPWKVDVDPEYLKRFREDGQGWGFDTIQSADKALWDDLFHELDFMTQRFPNVPLPNITLKLAPEGPHYDTVSNIIGIPGPFSDSPLGPWYEDWRKLTEIITDHRFVTKDITLPLGYDPVWIHEMSHYLTKYIQDGAPERVPILVNRLRVEAGLGRISYKAMGVTSGNDGFTDLQMRQLVGPRIFGVVKGGGPIGMTVQGISRVRQVGKLYGTVREQLGHYASTDIWEFIAESEAHYLQGIRSMEGNFDPYARIVGEWIDETLGISPSRVVQYGHE